MSKGRLDNSKMKTDIIKLDSVDISEFYNI